LTESASSRTSIDNAHYSRKSWLKESANVNIMRGKREKDNIEININHLPLTRTTPLRYLSINQ
jgi:hypothetical protein